MRLLLTHLFILISSATFAQNGNVKKQAEQMGNALLKKDYTTFVTFSYPTIISQMGGPEKMAATIGGQMKSMESTGAKVISLSYGTPSAVVKADDELQCTISQKMVVEMSAGKVASRTTLIAISQDKGKRWYFVDAGDRDIAAIRKSMPNVSKLLKLPKPEQPQLIK